MGVAVGRGVGVGVGVWLGVGVNVREGTGVGGMNVAVGGIELAITVLIAETASRVVVGAGAEVVQPTNTKHRVNRVAFNIRGSLGWFIL